MLNLKPEVVFSLAFTLRLKQESTKVVRVFKTVPLVLGIVHGLFEA